MADDHSVLQEALAVQSKAQLQIIATLQQHGQMLAEIHQMVSPPEVREDGPSLRTLLLTVLEKIERQNDVLDEIAGHIREEGAHLSSTGGAK